MYVASIALEHCLRSVFNIASDCPLVLRDAVGCAVPLGPGLAILAGQPIEGNRGADFADLRIGLPLKGPIR